MIYIVKYLVMGIVFAFVLTHILKVRVTSKTMTPPMAYTVLIVTWFPILCKVVWDIIFDSKPDDLEAKLNRPISEVDGLIKCKESVEMPGGSPDEKEKGV